jgi:hypothetical protein
MDPDPDPLTQFNPDQEPDLYLQQLFELSKQYTYLSFNFCDEKIHPEFKWKREMERAREYAE